MNDNKFNKLPNDLLLDYIKSLGHRELRVQCRTNQKFRRLCKEHEDEIYTNLLVRDFGEWSLRPKLVYNSLNGVFRKTDQKFMFKAVIDDNKSNELYALFKEYKFDVETIIIDSNFNPTSLTLLQYAVTRPVLPIECIYILIEFTANIDAPFMGTTPFLYMLGDDTGDVPSQLVLQMMALKPTVKNTAMDTMFHIGLKNDMLDAIVIEKLLSLEFDINTQNSTGDTPLHLLIEYNSRNLNNRMIERVLQMSPDYNLKNLLTNTVLLLAVQNYSQNTGALHLFISRVLENQGLDINIKTGSGFSAIMNALENDSFPSLLIQKMLRRQELDLDQHIKQAKQRTLLMQCVSHPSANEVYELIMSRSPSTNVVDDEGNTAAMIAVTKKQLSHRKLFKLIQRTDNLLQKNLDKYNLLELCLRFVRSSVLNDICVYIFSKVEIQVTFRMMNLADSNRHLNKANTILITGTAGITTSESDD